MAKDIIARYEIQSEIGRGGMATVYLAYDPNFRRKVAIKLVASSLQANDVFRERFEREAHLIAKIEHPAIVPVYDYGEHEHDLYLVMRYMPGGSLATKIQVGMLTLRESAQIISQIAPALDAVHAQGIVHRDLKPGNILFDGFGNPAISDFGIAHFTSATTDLTGSAIIGTPSYMSPEQVRGDAGLDGRSDIYAFGVILFEMLADHGPFQGTTPLSIAFKHLTDPIPSIRLFRPDLPGEVELIVNKALAKDRDMRYSTALGLALDLRAISDTSQEDKAPVLNPVTTSSREDAVTEVDVEETSQPAFDSGCVSQLENPPPSEPDADGSHNVPAAQAIAQESIDRSSAAGKATGRPARRGLIVVAILVFGLVLFFLCGSLGLLGTWAGLGFSGFFSSQDPTALPTITAGNSQNIVLFADDFSDSNSGWPATQNAQGGYRYQPNGYHIFVDEIDAVFWAKTGRQDDNVRISVDATPVSEGANGYYGLLCRMQDDQNFYYFVIRSNGDYTIGKYKDAAFQSLFPEGWRRSDVIHQGTQSNQLEADCSANMLRFYVNKTLLGEATDPDFVSGFSGMIVAALDAQGFEVRFNNFLITKPGQ